MDQRGKTPDRQKKKKSRVSPCEIFIERSGTGTGFSPSTSVFPSQFHFTGAPLQGRRKTLKAAVRP
jgi:hypothetical protein